MTIRLTSRCLDILNLLVAAEQPLAASEIGDRLNLSARMVRTSLAPAGPWLRSRDIALRQVRGRGLSLVGQQASKRQLADAIRTYSQPLPWLSSSERLHVTLLTLFFSESPVQLKQLQQVLNLARTTTIRVMDCAEEWLGAYGLQLIRRPNFGCIIAGDERHWRDAALSLLQESAGDARLLALLQGLKTVIDVSYRAHTGLEAALPAVWARLNIERIKSCLAGVEHEMVGMSSDQAYIRLCIYLAVTVYRCRMGKSIGALPDSGQAPSLARVRANEMAIRVHQQFGLSLPQTEVAWISLKLAECGIAEAVERSIPVRELQGNYSSVQQTVERILAQASLALHPSLSADADLVHNLTAHLERLLDAAPQQRLPSMRGPVLKELKSQFPHVYALAMKCGPILGQCLGREPAEAELGDIALCLIAATERLRRIDQPHKRVLVVCSEGAVTAWLLVSRLRAEFPDIDVAEVISALELESRRRLDGFDFIVSTIPLRPRQIPTKQVNPLLGAEDCRKLRELFEARGRVATTARVPEVTVPHLSDLITPAMIELGVSAHTWQQVVDQAASRLLQAGIVETRFVQAMKDIINEHGPYMVIWPGVVLLHAPPQGVRQLGMQLINLRHPVKFGHAEHDPVQVAVVLAAQDSRSHGVALEELNQMMQDAEARAALASTMHKSVVLHWIAHYTNSPEL